MDIRKLQRAIVDGLEDVKAQHISVLNTEHLSSLFERVIVASGASNRQTKALAASVRDVVRARGMPVLSVEGEENGEWIIVDCGAAVAHIMQPAIRDYYHLEEIWGGKPVAMKFGPARKALPKAEEPVETPSAPRAGAVPRKRARSPAVAASAAPRASANQLSANKTSAKQAPAAKPVSAKRPRKGAAASEPAASQRRRQTGR